MDNNFENQTPESTPEPNTVPEENVTSEANTVPEENVTSEAGAAPELNGNTAENRYTDPNAGAVYEGQGKCQEPPRTTISYTYGASYTGASQQSAGASGQNSGQAQQNTSSAYGSSANGGYNNNNYNNNYNSNYSNSSYGYNAGYQSEGMDTSPLSMGEWILTLLVGVVPCIGLIFYFIWAFDKNGNINRRNYCRAALIMQMITIVICVIFFGVIMVAGFSSFYYY